MRKRERIIHALLGKRVHVVVDRPIGYLHEDILYPINYGYIPGIIAGDGEEQDVYILGVDKPLASFDGRIIAAIRREDDREDKLVAARKGWRSIRARSWRRCSFRSSIFTAPWIPSSGNPAA